MMVKRWTGVTMINMDILDSLGLQQMFPVATDATIIAFRVFTAAMAEQRLHFHAGQKKVMSRSSTRNNSSMISFIFAF